MRLVLSSLKTLCATAVFVDLFLVCDLQNATKLCRSRSDSFRIVFVRRFVDSLFHANHTCSTSTFGSDDTDVLYLVVRRVITSFRGFKTVNLRPSPHVKSILRGSVRLLDSRAASLVLGFQESFAHMLTFFTAVGQV